MMMKLSKAKTAVHGCLLLSIFDSKDLVSLTLSPSCEFNSLLNFDLKLIRFLV